MIVMLAIALATLLLLGWYFGLRVYGIFTFRGVKPPKVAFWLVLAALLAVVFYTRSAFVATLLYGIMLFGLGDLLRVILRHLPAAGQVLEKLWQGGLTALILALVITVFGVINARSPVARHYDLTLDKDFGGLSGLRVVMVADTHLGMVVKQADLPQLVANINGQEPDVIALCGDIFEEGTPDALRKQAIEAFSGLEARYGVYYITGNHDSALLEGEAELLKASGVTILDDRWVMIADSVYIVGRQDSGHQGDINRQSAEALLAGADRARPVILLDHRPGDYLAAAQAGADLQLSGHTHAGQLWPFGVFSKLANGVNYGLEQVEDFSVIVTSGYGVWGFPVRTSGRCEYVIVDLTPNV